MVLLKYIIDSFWNQLVNFENLTVIHFLKVRYDQVFCNSCLVFQITSGFIDLSLLSAFAVPGELWYKRHY